MQIPSDDRVHAEEHRQSMGMECLVKIPIAWSVSSDGKSIWRSSQTIETRDMKIEINDPPEQTKFEIKKIIEAMVEGHIDEFTVKHIHMSMDEHRYLVQINDSEGNKVVHRVDVNKRTLGM